ncbi:MAG: rhodanese-like domain-containing protein [Verrucomicrobiales bacterium]
MKKILVTLACALFASFTFAGEYPDISISELEKAIENKEVILIDVNGSSSYANGHIPGAIDFRANKDNLAAALGDDKDKLVVAYCGGPTCSAYKAGASAAEEAGFKNIKHLSAGISGWLQAGKTTEKADKKS